MHLNRFFECEPEPSTNSRFALPEPLISHDEAVSVMPPQD